ncbi:MAG: DUF2007 domain-containing protein [Gemmatimonadaceae bacterium]|jgi:hypothetical protein|nr:DUF2007 domain-containing protein [Gemmatimonadaceae bacterium]
MSNDSSGPAQWVLVASYATGLEAEMARQQLENEGIPVLVGNPAPGIFGAGFQGNVTGGIRLSVPSPEVERSRLLLDLEP